MSINLENGLWRCFKTGKTGNFIFLYSILENCTYRRAYEKFLFESFLIEDKKVEKKEVIESLEDTSTFEKLDPQRLYDDLLMAQASEFVHSRNMEQHEFYVARDGFYKNRLIIPFFNSTGKLFYFQARTVDKEGFPKYLNCKTLKSSQVLYPFRYDSLEPLYITEGVFDCLALYSSGKNATTTLSCFCSNEQMSQLKQYRGPLIVAFDSDDAGRKGTHRFLSMALKHKIPSMSTVSLNGAYKDWNEALIANGKDWVAKTATNNVSELSRLSVALSGL